MTDNALIQTIGFTGPIVCAWVCIFLLLIHIDTGGVKEKAGRTLHWLLIRTYFVASLGWFGLVLYIINQPAFDYYQLVFLLSLMLDQVMLYHFVSIITATEGKPRFSPIHYLLPVLLTLAWFIVPFLLSGGFSAPEPDHPSYVTTWHHREYVGMSLIFIVYNSFYPALCLVRIRKYRRQVVDYSAEAQRTSLNWLSAMIVLILITVPLPLAALLLQVDVFVSLHLAAWAGGLPTFVVYLILCYNLLSDNYVIIEPANPDEVSKPLGTTLDRQRFERYIREKKPYLNPKLQISGMAADLHTNRSYLSAFINREYKMNFSRYVNRCRLQELEALRASPHRPSSNMEMVLLSGFSDYRSYTRTKAEEDKNRLLKMF